MPPTSAGILLFRRPPAAAAQVFLVHPGGPFWVHKDEGAWTVPKGLLAVGEDALAGARREFTEETGFPLPAAGAEHDLGVFRQPSGKRLHIFALEGECDPLQLRSNLFEMEWPPKSARMAQFPEIDRGAWFDRAQALVKITRGQRLAIEKFFSELA